MSLCSGYQKVDQFGPDDEYEDEEEIFYVTLELGHVEPTLIASCDSYQLIGLDTATPFLQLAGTVLKGRHETLLGTELLFSDATDASTDSVSYVKSTRQRIYFREVRLEKKSKTKEKVDVLDRKLAPRRSRSKKMEVVPEDY
ncbi:uncharacterized protein BT62DRAFT_936471 [Guyanagaster necrorhizus]|uniref:Transcription factor TFIIIC triple barrel domain-containing protein n=1 Tax=Guyanagaster necrorhizus TaxID=856835 RepID=A0A9P8ANU6_9AGAR|nr:uncharacterized protein BT62DRAFT_936471 [Guyanagaster necrorhizus MCA 3950]KAG7442116.1 hypothetical protein BT62DRAFT_936471 [Guyanagaster necrorhizus MCA 3950]